METKPLKVSMAKIAELTGESMPTIRRAIAEGHLPTLLVGRRRFAEYSAVEAWVAFLKSESDAGRPVTYRPRAAAGRPPPRGPPGGRPCSTPPRWKSWQTSW
jgi:excisionase family DNA binding protein